MGGERCTIRNGSSGGGTEKAFFIVEGKDVFIPKEGDMIVHKWHCLWWREVSNGAVEEHGNAAGVDGICVG